MKRLPQLPWNVTTVLFLVAVSICLAIVSGCSTNTVAPTTEDTKAFDWLAEQGNGVDADRGPSPVLSLQSCTLVFDTTLKAVAGDANTSFAVAHQADLLTFNLKKDMLPSPVELVIHATMYRTPQNCILWILDCGPDGTVFNTPLEVKYSTKDKNAKKSNVLLYFNETSGLWEVQEVLDAKSTKGFSIYHFSKYGIQ